MKRQKNEDFDECCQLKTTIEKNRKKEECYFKTNVLVSSQIRRSKKRRGRHCSGVTYLLRGETVRAGLARAERAAILHGDFTGKTHKIPQMSYLWCETKTRFLDFCLALQNRWNKWNKKCSWVWEQTKNIKVTNEDTKQLFHSLFLGCVCTQKIYSIPRGAMLLLVSLWLSKSLVF